MWTIESISRTIFNYVFSFWVPKWGYKLSVYIVVEFFGAFCWILVIVVVNRCCVLIVLYLRLWCYFPRFIYFCFCIWWCIFWGLDWTLYLFDPWIVVWREFSCSCISGIMRLYCICIVLLILKVFLFVICGYTSVIFVCECVRFELDNVTSVYMDSHLSYACY